ncbi:hypothetical protein K435DRAFT_661971 [Dendrothele bispora CBS 962.96]|uniref:LYC1 C-terminal domain-containing protein n=1 Tax=Dendrothele bispora (strain CBS 962.96) TaxID=1314807 RepID=A0A4S8M6G0_DENBC|nr:hypothetical protein K435DRAFT_661971 [Dendrothele bispora CBS 962.96]
MNANCDHLASHTLFPATPAQITESQRRRHKIWGEDDMTEEEYIQTDEDCAKKVYGRDGKLIVWVLAPRDVPETLDFKCSCRTFLRAAVVHFPPSFTDESKEITEQVYAYSIASVCTPPQHRGKGYAHHMMRLLHWILAPKSYLDPSMFPREWGSPPMRMAGMPEGQFSVLYSDIGDFYKDCGPTLDEEGWVIRGAENTAVWDVNEIPEALLSIPIGSSLNWKWLSESDIPSTLLIDGTYLKQPEKILFTFLPSSIESYQRDRSKMFWQKEQNPLIDTWGVEYRTAENNITAYATWSYELKPSSPRTLVFNRLRIPFITNSKVDPDSKSMRITLVYELFTRIFKMARAHKLTRIEAWDIPENVLGFVRESEGKVIERKEHLSAIKWYGKEGNGSVQWVFNERYVPDKFKVSKLS